LTVGRALGVPCAVDLEELRVLLSVVECGSVQGAARLLGIPRSQLRRRLDGLETVVGVPLLHRDAAGVRLTAAGAVVAERGRSVLESTRELLSEARAAAGEASGILRVFEPVGMPMIPRVQCLLAARDALPRVQFVVRPVEDPLAHLDEPCDMVLHDGAAPDKNTWFSRVIARVPLRALASIEYLRAFGTPRDVSDLAHHKILGWKRARERVDAWPLAAGGHVEVAPWHVTHDLLLVRALAAAGGGIAFMPHSPFLDEPGVAPLECVLDDAVGAEMVFRVSSRHPSGADVRMRDSLKLVETWLADFPER
jgi:DNA-binding transcriptional LysR family regulator